MAGWLCRQQVPGPRGSPSAAVLVAFLPLRTLLARPNLLLRLLARLNLLPRTSLARPSLLLRTFLGTGVLQGPEGAAWEACPSPAGSSSLTTTGCWGWPGGSRILPELGASLGLGSRACRVGAAAGAVGALEGGS